MKSKMRHMRYDIDSSFRELHYRIDVRYRLRRFYAPMGNYIQLMKTEINNANQA